MAKGIVKSAAAASAQADAIKTLIDAGTAAYVALLDSTDAVLGRVVLNDPSFGAAASGVITLDVDPAIVIPIASAGNGTISKIAFQSFTTPTYTTVITGTVGTTADYDCTLKTTTATVGSSHTITSFTFTEKTTS